METMLSFGNAKRLHARRRRGFNARERSEEAMVYEVVTCRPLSQDTFVPWQVKIDAVEVTCKLAV